ncbi:hypothetical protein GCK32_002270 [Trichostrongylus colubriformis]|uniref:Uncharacterized protein n=1 Tax=Trichostrongylus colubriformis TaxID=6319 RepID=A0AAN8FM85_TRICO
MWFILEFVYNYVLILLFLESWSLFLLVFYTLVAHIFLKLFPRYGSGAAVCVSLLLTSSLLFELIGLYNGDFLEERSGFSRLPSIFFTSSVARNSNWFGPLWKLNPVAVVAHLAGEVLVSLSGVCGRSVSAYYQGSGCRTIISSQRRLSTGPSKFKMETLNELSLRIAI